MQTMHRIGLSALAMPVALTLAGCGDKQEGKDKAGNPALRRHRGQRHPEVCERPQVKRGAVRET